MQNPGSTLNKKESPRWKPMQISNPSTKLRQARSMPQWVTRDTPSSSIVPPPPPPPDDITPPGDPDYEVIEFPSQQYSNTEPVIEKVRKSKTPGRCDLCGSSIPTVKCEHCPSQHFCASCDDMYHRHPKRQHHARKSLGPPLRPPLPPKGEPISAPVPPPRRNKHSSGSSSRFTPSPLPSQFQLSSSTHTLRKEPSGLIGSLKRFMGGRPLPPPPHMLSRDRMSQPTLQLKHNMDYQHDSNKPSSCDSGYLDWDSDRRTRSGSFSTINQMPTFGVMGQAQSMAQLNCPSCLHHPPGPMGWNDWTSTLNLQHPQPQAPPGWSTLGRTHMNTWHGSQMIPPSQGPFTPRDEFSRRNSLRHSARRSRRDSSSERSDFRHRDDVRSRHVDSSSEEEFRRGSSKHSKHAGRASPAMSYRSRHPLSDIDSEGDTVSRKGGRRRRRKSPVNPSPAMSRKSSRQISPTLSRRGDRHSPIKNRRRSKQGPSPTFSRKRNTSDTDSELSSEIEVDTKRSNTLERQVSRDEKKLVPWSKSSKAEDTISPHVPSPKTTKPSGGWECEHCTLVNPPGTSVCSVCCKTSNTSLAKPGEESVEEDLQKLAIAEENEQSSANGKQENGLKKGRAQSMDFLGRTEVISTGTSPPPQSISTQTYDYGGGATSTGMKRATSLADDVWRPIVRPLSRQSTLDSQSMATSPAPTPDIVTQDRAAYEFHKFTRSQSQQSQRVPASTDPPHQIIRPNFRRAGSQPPEYFSTAVQNQVKQGLEMVKLLREAEQNGFTAEDLTIALSHCGDSNPVTWLINNWRHMMDTVVTLATNYGQQQRAENDVGTLSAVEARDALRLHQGNVWAAVTECVETRQKKYNDLMSRGNFMREDIVTALTANHGNVESAYVELNKTQLKPFLMRIWGPPQGLDNDCGDVSRLRLEDDDIARNIGEVQSKEVSSVRDWLFEEKYLKQNRSKSLSEINQESYYVDIDDHRGSDNAIMGSTRLSHDKGNDSHVTHRISTIYSSNVDLRINTEPKQYCEGSNVTKQDSIDYIDDDDAESLTIRNTLHNEYVAAIVSNDTQLTNKTVNKIESQSVQNVGTMQQPQLLNNSNSSKNKTAFVPYSKSKHSADPEESNLSFFQASDQLATEPASQESSNSNNSTIMYHTESLSVKPNTKSNMSQELKYSSSFSGKNCKKPNVAKRKLTKSIKSVKKKVKSKFLGQKINTETEKESDVVEQSVLIDSLKAEETISKNRNEFEQTGNHIKTTVEVKQSIQPLEKNLEENKDQILPSVNGSILALPATSSNIKQNSIVMESKELLSTSSNEKPSGAINKKTKQLTETVRNDVEVESKDVQTWNKQGSNPEDKNYHRSEMKISNIHAEVSPKTLNNKETVSKGPTNNKHTDLGTSDKTSSVQEESIPTVQKNTSITLQTSTKPENRSIDTLSETLEENSNKDNQNPGNNFLFQTKKTITKAKNNKRNRWNKKNNQNVDKRKIDLVTNDIENKSDATNVVRNNNNIQQSRVTDVNFIDNKPKEKVTVEFEKDIIFLSDGETHKLIINPQIEKIGYSLEIKSSNNKDEKDEDKTQISDIVVMSSASTREQNNKHFGTNVADTTEKTKIYGFGRENNEPNTPKIINANKIGLIGPHENGFCTTPDDADKNLLFSTAKNPKENDIHAEKNNLVITHERSRESKNTAVRFDQEDEDQWEDDDDDSDEGEEDDELDENEKEVDNKEDKNSKPIHFQPTENSKFKLELKDANTKVKIQNFDIENEESDKTEDEYTDEGSDGDEEDDTKDETSITTESSNIITKQYIKPANQIRENTTTESVSDDQYVDAKDTSFSSGMVESSTDENTDFLSVQSEFTKMETFLNEMSVQPRSTNSFQKNSKNDKVLSQVENDNLKKCSPAENVNEKIKAVQILTSKISQMQLQDNYTNLNQNREVDSTTNKPFDIKINSPENVFEQSELENKKGSPSTSNSEKELFVLNTDRAGTSSSADISSDILDSSSRCDDRDIHKTFPQQSIKKNEKEHNAVDDTKMTMTENRLEILELLKQSLSNETVLEDIVNKLFSSVMGDTNVLNKVKSTKVTTNSNIVHYTNTSQETLTNSLENQRSQDNSSQPNQGAFNSQENANKAHSSNNLPLQFTTRQLHNRTSTPQSLAFSPTGSDGSDFEREVRRCLAEGLVSNYDQAELAVKLMQMSFNQELSVAAAKDCSTEQAALAYLQQECTLCAGKYPMGQMVSMLECEHHCCRDCAIAYFTLAITERSIHDCVCPFCEHPDLKQYDDDRALNYFSNLDILLKSFVDEKIHELFQRKLRDRTLMQDPHFKWCTKCSSGFIADPRHKKFICPDCNSVTCAKCNRPWAKEHERKSCDEYSAWLELADPNSSISKHLIENDGIVCPQCNSKYALAKGGCMHLTCPSCKYEFCSDCGRQFLMGSKCTVSSFCEKLGLHSHHPRNCLFYLRDKEPRELQKLLQDAGVEFKADESPAHTKCKVQLQREVNGELQDSLCNLPVESATLCRTHYIEYLAKLIHQYKLDPVVIFELNELLQELRRRGKSLPHRSKDASDQLYRDVCIKIIQEEIPLE